MPRQKFRLVAVDIDGTLLCPRGTVTPRTQAAVARAVAQGVRVCFATGRSWRESRKILQAVNHFDNAVFVTGAMVVDTRAERMISRRLMGAQLAGEVAKFLEERGQTVLAYQDSGRGSDTEPGHGREQVNVDYLVTEGGALDPATQYWIKMTESVLVRRGDLAEISAHPHTLRISIVAQAAHVQRCYRELSEAFGPRVACHELVLPSSGTNVLEVFEPVVNKWHGVMQVANLHGIAEAEIVAVGDDVNDISMIRGAGLGVAMGNASPAATAAAKRVIGHNGEDGLARFLEELLEGMETESKAPKGLALSDGRHT